MTTVFPTIDQAEFQTDISNEIHSSIESSFLTLDDEIGSMNSHLSKLDIQLKEEENTTSLMSISGSSSSSLSSYHKPDSADYSPVSSTEIDITLGSSVKEINKRKVKVLW
jgi:hypothetical protein